MEFYRKTTPRIKAALEYYIENRRSICCIENIPEQVLLEVEDERSISWISLQLAQH